MVPWNSQSRNILCHCGLGQGLNRCTARYFLVVTVKVRTTHVDLAGIGALNCGNPVLRALAIQKEGQGPCLLLLSWETGSLSKPFFWVLPQPPGSIPSPFSCEIVVFTCFYSPESVSVWIIEEGAPLSQGGPKISSTRRMTPGPEKDLPLP